MTFRCGHFHQATIVGASLEKEEGEGVPRITPAG